MSKGPSEATTTTNEQLPAYAQAAQQNVINLGQQLTSPFMQVPQYAVAGMNPDQLAAQSGYRDLFTNEVQNYRGPTGQAAFTAASPAVQATAAQLDPGEINQFVDSYVQAALDPALANMRNQYGQNLANFDAKMAAGGAYGGSRQAVGDAQMAKDFNNQVAQTAGSMLNSGWNTASGLAENNAQMRQQAALANAAAANNIDLQNASMANNMASNNASREMQSNNDWFSHALQGLSGLQTSGDKQQAFEQQALDTPWTMYQRLIAGTPSLNNVGGTKTTTQPLQDNTMSTMLGLGLMGAKLFGLSDDDEKTNKQKVGEDPKTGVPIYAYDYKSDVEQAKKSGKPMGPKRVGPMASDMQKLDPDSVKKVGGKKVVSMPLMAMIMQGGGK